MASVRPDGPGPRRSGGFDVVYTWADRSDPDWQAARLAAWERFVSNLPAGAALPPRPGPEPPGARDSLRYSLRSLHRYLRGMRKLFIVTDRSPSWLVADHPALEVVSHEAVFDDPRRQLPSYNSQAIHAGLHLIPGLAERFVSFDDDFFLLRPHDRSRFFTADGRIRVRLGRTIAARGPSVPDEPVDTAVQRNTSRALDAAFGRRTRLTIMHRPCALTKEVMRSAEARFPEEFARTRELRFRTADSSAVHNGLVPFAAVREGMGRFVPPRPWEKDIFHWTGDPGHNERIVRRLMRRRQSAFCVQERCDPDDDRAMRRFRTLMETLYPVLAPFES